MAQTARNHILPTKLRPPESQLPPIVRPRLLEALGATGAYRLGLVCAPAGFGKTTTLAQLHLQLGERGIGAAWLSVDGYDDEPHRFLAGLVAAVRALEPGLAGEAQGLLALPDVPAREVAASLAGALLEFDRELVLIVDDYHEIQDPEVHATVDYLLRYLPKHVSLVLGARQAPPLALARLRVRGWLRELDWHDLRFTVEEARRYLRGTHGLDLTDAQAAALSERAEGWITGLQLAAMSLGAGADAAQFVQDFSGAQVDVADYLMQDVFQRQPEDVQHFLLRSSVLGRLSAPLCDAVLERRGSQDMLERLDRGNLFLFRLDSTRSWYRYHHLFADFLRTRLRAADPGAAARLLGRAKDWFEAHDQPLEALTYAIEGGLYTEAARLLAQLGREMFYRGEFKDLRYWLERLPADALRASPELCALHAWSLAYLGEFALARERILWAGAALAEAPDARGRAELDVLRVAVGVIQADEPELESVAPDLPDAFPPQDTTLRAMAHVMVAYALRARHQLGDALRHVEEAVGLSEEGGTPLVNLLARFNLGGLLHLRGNAAAAERVLRESEQLARQRRWTRSMGMAFVRVQHAVVLQEQYRLNEAEHELGAAIEVLEATGAYGFLGVAYTESAKIHLLRGAMSDFRDDLKAATAIAEAHRVTRVQLRVALLSAREALAQGRSMAAEAALRPYLGLLQHGGRLSEKQEALLLTHIRVLLSESRYAEALEWARLGGASAAAAERGRNQCELLVLESEALTKLDEPHQAEQKLARALALGEAGGLVLPFLVLGLERLEALADSQPYAARVVEAIRKGAEAAQPELDEPLHPRETQILQLLAQGLRNREIGERLFLSEETVKWYLKKLFRKLDVGNRTQAIVWAQEHGLLA